MTLLQFLPLADAEFTGANERLFHLVRGRPPCGLCGNFMIRGTIEANILHDRPHTIKKLKKLKKLRDRRNVFSSCLKRFVLLIIIGHFQSSGNFPSVPRFPQNVPVNLAKHQRLWREDRFVRGFGHCENLIRCRLPDRNCAVTRYNI